MGVTSTHDLRVRAGEFLRRPGAAVLLDLDGTLVDSEPMQRAAFAAYFASRGWEVPEAVVRQFMGRRGRESFAAIAGPWAGEDPVALTDAVIAMTDPVTHPPVPVPGAAEAIRAWREQDLPVSLVTSAFRSWAEEALELLGAADLGVRLVTAEDTPVGKPAPAPFLLGAERLGVDPADCLAAEDSVAGLASARAAGVGFVVGVTTSLGADALAQAGADAVVPDLTTLAP
ncbi:HAD family hydrolase [Oceanitalea stevensii]|uniref:HAD family phosphatase n=1 Tax=Oceanitalea stevensii TaxID=2763072 RepID=A0ABR8Z4G0_9MICO|nr:HAD family phosphatase [Oceanitalea stevensii]MBD8063150.1 HAD family phosphatase [Oceanitalea stevensii]